MPNNTRWTKEEEDILRQHYPWIPSRELLEVLPHRTDKGLHNRAHSMGIKKAGEVRSAICSDNAMKRRTGSGRPLPRGSTG